MRANSQRCLHVYCLVWLLAFMPALVRAADLLIGAEDDWAPYSSVVKGQPVGMAVDIVSAIFAEAGIVVQLVPMRYDRCMKETLSGSLQGCFNTSAGARVRREYLFHTRPLFSDTPLILARKIDPINAILANELGGHKVAVTSGYTYGDAIENNSAIQRIQALGDVNTLRMIQSGEADLGIVYRRILAFQTKEKGRDFADTLKTVGALPSKELYLSFSRRMPEAADILKKFNSAHQRLMQSGAIANIEKNWD